MRTMSEPKLDPNFSRDPGAAASGMFRRRCHPHEEHEPLVGPVLDPVGLAGRRQHRLARTEILDVSLNLEAASPFEHDVVLRALLVHVDLLALAGLEAVDVEE